MSARDPIEEAGRACRCVRLLPGRTLLEQIFICSNGAVYCDHYPGSGNNYLDLSAIAPGNPSRSPKCFTSSAMAWIKLTWRAQLW